MDHRTNRIQPVFTAGKARPIAMARVRVGDLEKSLAADANREAVVFTASLKVGIARLQTWFYDRKAKKSAARTSSRSKG